MNRPVADDVTARIPPAATDPEPAGPKDGPAPAGWAVWCFIGLIALTPATPHVAISHTPFDVSDLTTLAAVVIGIATVPLQSWRPRLSARRAPEVYALAAMVPLTFIAAVHARSAHSLAAGPARWLLNTALVALAYALLRTSRDGGRMIRAIIGVATFEAAFGLVAYLLRWSGPGGYLGIERTPFKVGSWLVIGRITGTTGMAATFIAGLFALAVPAAVGLSMAARGRSRWGWAGAAVVIFAGLALTLSRTPIGLTTVAIVVLLLAGTRPRVWIPVLVVVAAVFLATPLRSRMTDFQTDRLKLWYAGWHMFTDHLFLGVGPDRYMVYFDQYKHTPWGTASATPHNSLLYVAAESGLFAALALLVAIGFSLRFLRTRNPLVLGPMLGLAVFVVDAMTTNLYSIPSIAVIAWMIAPSVAPLMGRSRGSTEPAQVGSETGSPLGPTKPAPAVPA